MAGQSPGPAGSGGGLEAGSHVETGLSCEVGSPRCRTGFQEGGPRRAEWRLVSVAFSHARFHLEFVCLVGVRVWPDVPPKHLAGGAHCFRPSREGLRRPLPPLVLGQLGLRLCLPPSPSFLLAPLHARPLLHVPLPWGPRGGGASQPWLWPRSWPLFKWRLGGSRSGLHLALEGPSTWVQGLGSWPGPRGQQQSSPILSGGPVSPRHCLGGQGRTWGFGWS